MNQLKRILSSKWFVPGLMGFAVVALIGNLAYLQLVNGQKYFNASMDNLLRTFPRPAPRGEIVDERGTVLAGNKPEKRRPVKGNKKYQPPLEYERTYPQGTRAAHVLGYVGAINSDELKVLEKDGYIMNDYMGRAGLEREYEAYLHGRDGYEQVLLDARNREHNSSEFDEFEGRLKSEDPIPGRRVVVTLNLDLQAATEAALAHTRSGAAVVIDVRTGRILALASQPTFRPEDFVVGLSSNDYLALNDPELRPLLNKAVSEQYHPGSTFKVVTALAALGSGMSPFHEEYCPGYYRFGRKVFHCMHQHEHVDLHMGIVASCNTYFYALGEKYGLDSIAVVARNFGFGALTGIDIAGEVPGTMPDPSYYATRGGMQDGYSLNTAIGQGDVTVTVLQLASAYAAIATGVVHQPQLVSRIETSYGSIVHSFEPKATRLLDTSRRHLAEVRSALCGVVSEKKGTVYTLRHAAPVAVCGKTGTAQVKKIDRTAAPRADETVDTGWDKEKDHAWFASYAPADDPEIAVVVLAEHGGFGAQAAAPIAMEIYRNYFATVEPTMVFTADDLAAGEED